MGNSLLPIPLLVFVWLIFDLLFYFTNIMEQQNAGAQTYDALLNGKLNEFKQFLIDIGCDQEKLSDSNSLLQKIYLLKDLDE